MNKYLTYLLRGISRKFKDSTLFPNRKWTRIYDKRGYYGTIFGRRYYLKIVDQSM